ncbi:lipid-A-disaccharide synthase [Aliiruegeria haliotis]|uniref:Lipid-A-disaccharide synthase n=1 Tax=Aliiruegeria haliotis TaxID=1280846 RepID=A0A2T0S023_9RHOB|nr:lipid-A-disaccharide synthase [Aliiruegeria haliotis]PRY26653.1 lipid-A-disaccharide synthase [Aliiruegeria haliotis]
MRLFLVAGEPSGDKLGAALMAGLKQLAPGVEFHGIGGPLMEAEGMKSLFPMSELSVVGLSEILPKYFDLKRRIQETAAEVVQMAPDALITIDIPEFSLRVAKLVRKAAPEQHTVHYVAPTVWAWRPGRAKKMAPDIDQVLALLPFEPPYMEAVGMRCDFVGHPVVAEPQADAAAALAFRERHGIAPDAPLILGLPGSRRGEIAKLGPIFGDALARVVESVPDARVVVPTVAARADLAQEVVGDWPCGPILLDPRGRDEAVVLAEKRAAFRAADVALAASGTVSLELAAADTPMVIGYDGAWLNRVYITRMLLVDTVTLVNLVSETRAVPEFLGKACKAEDLAPAVLDVLRDSASQHAAMALSMDRLGRGQDAPGLRAARAVLDGLDRR